MKIARILFLLCTVVFTLSCSSLQVYHDYDPKVDFTNIKTYDWLPIPENLKEYELTIKHIRSAVNRGLESKGLSLSYSNPDMMVAIHGGLERKVDIEEWGYKHGEFRSLHKDLGIKRYDVYKRRGVDVYEYMEGTLILDFVGADSRELIWRGEGTWESSLGPTREDINKIIDKILEGYPPVQ